MPIKVTLLFSSAQYVAASEAYLRGIERRVTAGLNPDVVSVASLFINRWDRATMGKVPVGLQNSLEIAVAKLVYAAHRELLDSPHWQRLANSGAKPQRLLWASTSTKGLKPPMFSTSRRLRRYSPSIQFPRIHYSLSTTTER